ncbi:MAG: hypothetical protein M3209_17575 [Acidobacteriota bacterium]|nr:hypothetical protein [Acidobacteriota bacterium]
MKIRFAVFAALALLNFAFTNIVSAQADSQIYQPCGKLSVEQKEDQYPSETFIWKKEGKEMVSVPIDQVHSTGSKMVFTFVPVWKREKDYKIYTGEKIKLDVYPYGREEGLKLDSNLNLVPYLNNLDAIKNLDLPDANKVREFQKKVKNDAAFAEMLRENPQLGVFKVSNLKEEQYLVIGLNENALAKFSDKKDDWYAFLHYIERPKDATDDWDPVAEFEKKLPEVYRKKIVNGKSHGSLTPYVSPVENPGQYLENKKVPTSLIPLPYFSFEGEPKNVDEIYGKDDIKKQELALPAAFLKKLNAIDNSTSENNKAFFKRTLELDTTDLPTGYYWVTLQGNAVFDGEYKGDCPKTTPPVLIHIEPRVPKIEIPPVANRPPKLTLNPTTDCKAGRVSVIAKPSDPDIPAQTLKIRDWKIYEGEGNDKKEIPLSSFSYEFAPNADDPQSLTINGGLQLGVKYTFEATVSDGEYKTTADQSTTLICPNSAAGIFYFGFATPNKKDGNILDPEEWTTDRERLNEKPETEGKYPEAEFATFYEKISPRFKVPEIDSNNNNTVTLNRIVDAINANPGYKLYVYGYADFSKTKNYSNFELAKRRIDNAVAAIRAKLSEKGLSFNQVIAGEPVKTNRSDCYVQTCTDRDTWSDERRHDRRVEVLYVLDTNQIKLPEYEPKPECRERCDK